MPRITDEVMNTPHGYHFNTTPATDLEASEYTLVSIIQDQSGSVDSFKTEMISCLKEIIDACKKSPRAENLLLRTVLFNNKLTEFHGFKMLNSIDQNDYDDVFSGLGGMTALYDATHTSIDATLTYGATFPKSGINCNAVIFVITDGEDNSSNFAPYKIKNLLDDAKKSEGVESVTVVLIGVTGGDAKLSQGLEQFKNAAGLDQFVDIGEASKNKLAKLASFVSRSISSVSQSLGRGASQPLTF